MNDEDILRQQNEALRATVNTYATRIAELTAENAELHAMIIEADSAYNILGRPSAWDKTSGLVRMCHEGAAALAEVACLRAAPEPAPHTPEPAVMLADIDNPEPVDVLSGLPF